MINLNISKPGLERNIKTARERGLILPTFSQLCDPAKTPEQIVDKLRRTDPSSPDPVNLFRISWKNGNASADNLFGPPRYIEIPKKLTGINARIIALAGASLPGGTIKSGSALGCISHRFATGSFNAAAQYMLLPQSEGFLRGGSLVSALMGIRSIAITAGGAGDELLDFLDSHAAESYATPGEGNPGDEFRTAAGEIKRFHGGVSVLDPYADFGGQLWHYKVTGNAISEIYESLRTENSHFFGACFMTGSAGTLGAGDRLRELYPDMKLAACELSHTPILTKNVADDRRFPDSGYGCISWIHNVRSTDLVVDVNDENVSRLSNLFARPEGGLFLGGLGLTGEEIESLRLGGPIGISNILACVKLAKYYELGEREVIATVLPDSPAPTLPPSGTEKYTEAMSAMDYAACFGGNDTSGVHELSFPDKKRMQAMKEHSWVREHGKSLDEARRQWSSPESVWGALYNQAEALDAVIEEFNSQAAVI